MPGRALSRPSGPGCNAMTKHMAECPRWVCTNACWANKLHIPFIKRCLINPTHVWMKLTPAMFLASDSHLLPATYNATRETRDSRNSQVTRVTCCPITAVMTWFPPWSWLARMTLLRKKKVFIYPSVSSFPFPVVTKYLGILTLSPRLGSMRN